MPFLEKNGLSTDGTFPRIVAEQRIDFSFQEAFPHQAAHFAPAFRAFHVDSSFKVDDEILKAAQLTVPPFPTANART
jgi:hypothetical protein